MRQPVRERVDFVSMVPGAWAVTVINPENTDRGSDGHMVTEVMSGKQPVR